MNSSGPGTSLRRLLPEHIRQLLIHVDAEEVSLRNAIRLLQDLPLDSGDEARHRELRQRIDQSLQHFALLADNRNRVIKALAEFLGIPGQDVSFSALLPYASPQSAAQLVAARQRLQRLVTRVSVLVHTAVWIVNESRRIQLTIFESLPGTVTSSRYDATGQRSLNPASFRFETRS